MKKHIILILASLSTGYCQLGWESYTGQPTSTLYGSAIGAGAGYLLGPAISKGCDAQWITALAGAAAGGLVGNYMAGDNNMHQKLMNSSNAESSGQRTKPAKNIGTGIKINKNIIQSPWSDYAIDVNDYNPGQVITDPITGQLFRLPR